MLAPTLRDTHPCAPDTHFSLAACASRAGLAPTNPLQGERKLRTKRGSEGAGEGEGKELGLWTVRGMPQCFCMNLTRADLASSRVMPSYDTHLVLRQRARLSEPPSKPNILCMLTQHLVHAHQTCTYGRKHKRSVALLHTSRAERRSASAGAWAPHIAPPWLSGKARVPSLGLPA
jgi:hypothetical protein